MADKNVRGVHRRFTAAERERFRKAVEEEKRAMPVNRADARGSKPRAEQRCAVFRDLQAERQKQGVTLAQLAERSGIDKARLSRLENDPFPNVTIDTLERLAAALGKDLVITLKDAA